MRLLNIKTLLCASAALLLSGCQKSDLDKCVEEQYDNYYDYINGLPFDQQGNALAVITDEKCGHLYGNE